MRKRHKVLHPLSHHHHHALVAALKLKRAGTEKSVESAEEVREALKHFWTPGGQEHFREEEEILLPAFARFASVDQPIIHEMLTEHVKIRARIQEIFDSPEPELKKLNELGVILEAHVRKEERIIFPMIEDTLSEQQLEKLAPYFHMNHNKTENN
ncbi:MAG TPA: hemerythrin domain-containing protein [Bacillales bacterium]|nr:hemerythrin domain-containing protein [Bacillales bacterium]